MATETVEQAMLSELTEALHERKGQYVRSLATGSFETLDQARELVGYIKAYGEVEDIFVRIIKAFFPT